jgi:hypothetical protein
MCISVDLYIPFTCLVYGCDNGFHILKKERGLVLLGAVGEKGVKMAVKGFLIVTGYCMCNRIR